MHSDIDRQHGYNAGKSKRKESTQNKCMRESARLQVSSWADNASASLKTTFFLLCFLKKCLTTDLIYHVMVNFNRF